MGNTNAVPTAGNSIPVNEPLTKALFMKHFELFPKGNPQSTYELLKYNLSHAKDFKGKSLTHDFIFEKWKAYLEMCTKESRKEMYVKSFERFLVSKDYNIEFSPKLGSSSFLDKYDQGGDK